MVGIITPNLPPVTTRITACPLRVHIYNASLNSYFFIRYGQHSGQKIDLFCQLEKKGHSSLNNKFNRKLNFRYTRDQKMCECSRSPHRQFGLEMYTNVHYNVYIWIIYIGKTNKTSTLGGANMRC